MSHSHSHNHNHQHHANKKALLISFIFIAGFMFVELVGGYLTNSLALLSDAGHMLSDAVALGLSYGAITFASKAATSSKTYGYKRFEILAAFINGIVLILIAVLICKEAVERLYAPPQVLGGSMMVISIVGLIVNLLVAYILFTKGSVKENLNVRSAFLHVIGDLLGSVGAIVAAILILAFGWYIADPIASMIVSVLVLYSGWNVLRESAQVLMESKPATIDERRLQAALLELHGVKEVHDLHIWMLTPDYCLLTAHLCVDQFAERDAVLQNARLILLEKFGINHVTIQIEGVGVCSEDERCN